MIQKNNFLVYPDEDESGYPFKICPCCPLRHQCELTNSFTVKQFEKNKSVALPVVLVNPLYSEKDKVYPAFTTIAKRKRHPIYDDNVHTEPPLYMKPICENGNCPMGMFDLVECRNKWVADGIGDDFKIDIQFDWKSQQYRIEKSSSKRHFDTQKWEPRQPVIISAQTGNGKNHFIENALLKFIRDLNYRNKTNFRILILSNRRALTEQTKDRLKNGTADDSKIYNYGDYVDIMPYHSLLSKVEQLKQLQSHGKSKYLFVICDEAHFFTSDAAFNPDTIQQRVTDSYYSRSQKGFKMGGRTPYGYRKEPFVLDGVKTQRFVIEPTEAALVTQMYEMYARPEVSYRDVVKEMEEQGVKTFHDKAFMHTSLKRILKNPLYVLADMDVYNFYKTQGTVIESDPDDFVGTNGCYYYKGRDINTDKSLTYEGHRLVVAPHEGFIPSELWLTVNKKLNTNKEYQPARKASNTWLAGKMKCGHCGYALKVSGVNTYKYMTCTMRAEMTSRCKGVGGPLHLPEVEALVYAAMVEKLKTFRTLQEHKKSAKVNPKLVTKQAELAKVESEIENLIGSLKSAGAALVSYVNIEIEKLDMKRRTITQEIATLTTNSVSSEQIAVLSDYLDDWENVSLDDKRHVVDVLIVKVSATYEDIQIQWKL